MSGAVLRRALPSRPPTSTIAPKLSTGIQKKLLCFNSDLPHENMEVWVTMEEMRDRLIHIGVDCVLSTVNGGKRNQAGGKGADLKAKGRVYFLLPPVPS